MLENVPEITYTKMKEKKNDMVSFLMEFLPSQERDNEKIIT